MFGPPDEQIKQRMNKKLREKQKRKRKQNEKAAKNMTDFDMDFIKGDGAVDYVEEDTAMTSHQTTSQEKAPWHLDRIDQFTNNLGTSYS